MELGIGLALPSDNPTKKGRMNPVVNEFAAMNLVVIWLIVLAGFAFLKAMKKSMGD